MIEIHEGMINYDTEGKREKWCKWEDVEPLIEALKFYADSKHFDDDYFYDEHIYYVLDKGETAQKALKIKR